MATYGKSIFDFDYDIFDKPLGYGSSPVTVKTPVKAPEASNTYYVIFGTDGGGGYIAPEGEYLAGQKLENARQFPSMGEALKFISRGKPPWLMPCEIRRVTRSTTPGTTSRRVLDHGEQAPVGSVVKYIIWNGASKRAAKVALNAPGCSQPQLNYNDAQSQVTLEEAVLFDSEAIATQFQQPKENCWRFVRRVALIATEPKVTYKEEVVQ